MMLESVQYLGLMVVCLLMIILLMRILLYVRKQANEVRKLDERLKLMENIDKKGISNNV